MLKNITIASIALAGAFAASNASAHESYGHSHNSTGYVAPGYTAPTVNLGPIEQVQPNSTVQYAQPTTTYIQPATTSTYTYPSTTQTYTYAPTTSTFVQPATTSTYTYPTTTYPTVGTSYTTPSYAAQPTYGQTYYAPPAWGYTPSILPQQRYDGTQSVRNRLDRLRSRISNANARGDLRRGERKRLRGKMRNIRDTFRDYRANDGVIDGAEHRTLISMMDRQSRRIRRLANNDRVQGPLVSPYGHRR